MPSRSDNGWALNVFWPEAVVQVPRLPRNLVLVLHYARPEPIQRGEHPARISPLNTCLTDLGRLPMRPAQRLIGEFVSVANIHSSHPLLAEFRHPRRRS